MNPTLVALVLAGLSAAPAFAAGGMSCADFSTLDVGSQAEMVGSMMSGPAADDGASYMGDALPGDATGSMMGSDDASDAMMTGDDDAADSDRMASDIALACAENPEMEFEDAMSGAMAQQ